MKRRRRPLHLGVLLVVLVSFFLGSAGCSSDRVDCAFHCVDGECGDGFMCTPAGWCVREGSTATCSGTASGGTSGTGGGTPGTGGNAGDPGTGGAGSIGGAKGGSTAAAGAPQLAGAGSTSEAGAASEAGAGGAPNCDGEGPHIELRLADSRSYLCVDEPATLTLVALGGLAPFDWQLLENEHFTLGSTRGSEVTLSGTPPATGEYTLEVVVRDACEREGTETFPVDVLDKPQFSRHSLPDGCAGGLYKATLDVSLDALAQGVWSSENLPAGLSVDATSGVITGSPEAAGDFEFDLILSNDCGRAPAAFDIHVNDVDRCPISLRPSEQGRQLSPPCRAAHWSANFDSLVARGWEALELPPGLSLSAGQDPLHATVSGRPTSPGNLILGINAGGVYVVSGMRVEPRDHCWFAYISDDGESSLTFFDPRLYPEFGVEHSAQQRNVVSFAFSPSGRMLAYAAPGSSVRDLFIVNLETWEERSVSFGADVGEYAWSDSELLAVVFGQNGSAQLSGLDATQIDWGAPHAIETFQPVPVTIGTPLSWIGNTFVAYLSAGAEPDSSTLHLTHRPAGTSGFSAPSVVGPEYIQPALLPTHEGLFITDWRPANPSFPERANARIDFVVPAQTSGANHSLFEHATTESVSPGGSHTGQVTDGVLSVFRPNQNTLGQSPEPFQSISNCSKLLAWTPAGDRVACVNDSNVPGEAGEIRLFSTSSSSSSGQVVQGTGNYGLAASHAERRGFSASGNWFAFVTDQGVFVADTREPPRPLRAITSVPQRVIDFEFSPDDRVLLVQRDDYSFEAVSLVDEPTPPALPWVESFPCIEEYVHAPGQWCGRIKSMSGFQWSSTETVVAYRTTDRALVVLDLTNVHGGEFWPALDGPPAKQFAFQPNPEIPHQ